MPDHPELHAPRVCPFPGGSSTSVRAALAVIVLAAFACNLPAASGSVTRVPPTESAVAGSTGASRRLTLAADSPAASPVPSTQTPPPASPSARTENVQELMTRCPTAEEVAAIDRDVTLRFEVDPFNGQLVCGANQGSADLTTLQLRAYQALLAMRRLRFDAPLPWTSLSLYDWFNQAIDAVRFRGDIQYSHCCDPERTINIDAPHLLALETDQWLDPRQGEGIQGLMVLLIHEARHSEGYWHTCGTIDTTIDEMAAFGIQYWTYVWLAYHSDPAFLTPGGSNPALYREMNRNLALGFRAAREQGAGPFCKEATITPGPTPTVW